MEATEESHLTIVTTRTEKDADVEAAHAPVVNEPQDTPSIARRDIYGFPIPSHLLDFYDECEAIARSAHSSQLQLWGAFLRKHCSHDEILSELSRESKQALTRIIAACQARMTPKEMSPAQSRESDASKQGGGNGNDTTEDRVDEKVCEEFIELVLGGIPRELRKVIWPLVLGIEERIQQYPNHYQALVELGGSTEETASQIAKDLPRTFASHPEMKEKQAALRRLLTAVAAHDTMRGYVQSMNFLAALFLIMGLDEEAAFWALLVLVETIVPEYFDEGMKGAKADQIAFENLASSILPDVGLHLFALSTLTLSPSSPGSKSQNLPASNTILSCVASQWFLSVFCNVTPTESTLRLWDVVFFECSRRGIFCMGLALVAQGREELISAIEMGDAVEVLQNLGERAFPTEALWNILKDLRNKFTIWDIDRLAGRRGSYGAKPVSVSTFGECIWKGTAYSNPFYRVPLMAKFVTDKNEEVELDILRPPEDAMIAVLMQNQQLPHDVVEDEDEIVVDDSHEEGRDERDGHPQGRPVERKNSSEGRMLNRLRRQSRNNSRRFEDGAYLERKPTQLQKDEMGRAHSIFFAEVATLLQQQQKVYFVESVQTLQAEATNDSADFGTIPSPRTENGHLNEVDVPFSLPEKTVVTLSQSLLAAGRLLEPIEVPTQRIQRILQNSLLPLKVLASASFEKDRLAYLELERIYQQKAQYVVAEGGKALAWNEKTLWGIWAYSPFEKILSLAEEKLKALSKFQDILSGSMKKIVETMKIEKPDLDKFSQESLALCKVSFVNWISQSAKVAGKEFENEQRIALADVETLKEQYKIVQEMCSDHQVRIEQVFREYGTAIEKERHAQALQLWKNFPIMPADSQKEAELEIHAVIESKESIDAALSSLSDTSETHSFFMNNLNSTRQADDKAHSLPSSPDPLISGDGPRSASSGDGRSDALDDEEVYVEESRVYRSFLAEQWNLDRAQESLNKALEKMKKRSKNSRRECDLYTLVCRWQHESSVAVSRTKERLDVLYERRVKMLTLKGDTEKTLNPILEVVKMIEGAIAENSIEVWELQMRRYLEFITECSQRALMDLVMFIDLATESLCKLVDRAKAMGQSLKHDIHQQQMSRSRSMSESPKNRRANSEDDSRGLLRAVKQTMNKRGGSPIGNSRSSDFPNQHSKLGAAGATSSSHSHSSSNSDKPRSKRDETTIRELEVDLNALEARISSLQQRKSEIKQELMKQIGQAAAV